MDRKKYLGQNTEKLWNIQTEIQFFSEALKNFASPEQLFYNLKDGYFAYIPKGYDAEGQTLQSRNSLIGKFTEKWCKNLLEPIATKLGFFALNDVICEEIGLTKQSSADLAFCTSNGIVQKPENIKIVFEIKMSIVSNYKFSPPNNIQLFGDYKQHKGFWSLNPKPTDGEFIKTSPKLGFQTITSMDKLFNELNNLLMTDMNYFSSMITKQRLGEIIRIASLEQTDIQKAERFLSLLRE